MLWWGTSLFSGPIRSLRFLAGFIDRVYGVYTFRSQVSKFTKPSSNWLGKKLRAVSYRVREVRCPPGKRSSGGI